MPNNIAILTVGHIAHFWGTIEPNYIWNSAIQKNEKVGTWKWFSYENNKINI